MHVLLLSVGLFFLLNAGLFHVYVFALESLIWVKPKTWRTFGLPSQEHAEIMRSMAFNQGFYNLFLSIGAIGGAGISLANRTIGFTLMYFASASMVGAGLVLFLSVKSSRRAALIQAVPPLIGLVLTSIGLAIKS